MSLTSAPIDLDTRRQVRWDAVAGPYGIASLRHTHWLDTEPRAYAHAPGTWAARAGKVVGSVRRTPGAVTDEVALAPGETAVIGDLELRAIERDGALALRVFDPESPTRTQLLGIHSFPWNADWVIEGAFIAASEGESRVVRSIDGHERQEPAVGVVVLEVAGQPVHLTVSRGGRGFSAVVSDATSGEDSYRFRFLPIEPPDADGNVVIDFNRLFLPPCAFSDQYVCPLPPAGNRLGVRVEAGERIIELEPTARDT
jgi:uncharacterized protein (DUF1684 family)